MIAGVRGRRIVGLLVLPALLLPGWASAAPASVQEAYWWLDEIRTAAFALSRQRTGRISRWPRLTAPAGSATLPLPAIESPIVADGRLDELAWRQATSVPIGPVFGPWRDGPFLLRLRACRDARQIHLAIESPRPLTALGCLSPQRELLTVAGKTYRADKPGRVTGGAVSADGKVLELSLPLGKAAKGVPLSLPVELVAAPGGTLPAELAGLGLTKLAASRRSRQGASVWLEPIAVTLLPSPARAEVRWETAPDGQVRLLGELIAGEERSKPAAVLKPADGSGVRRYTWQASFRGQAFRCEGFLYVEPVRETLAAAGQIARRVGRRAGGSSGAAGLTAEIRRLEARLAKAPPRDAAARRKLYCAARELRARAHRRLLDAPLLFVKRGAYFAVHIYDDYYTYHPGGAGIYVLENPAEPLSRHRVRAVIDAGTKPTLGAGVYRGPDLSWDGRRVLFAYRASGSAWTSLYEIGVDGTGLRRLTKPEGYHDITPCYLPNGRIAFTSTRPKGRVPCFNSGVDTLHTMAADGSDIRSISSNNVTEFDPSVLPDGRILYGRWEYVDKTALYMQSLWTMFPDGTHETALFANNLARPTAVLDARAVPGTRAIVASLTPHNGQAVGAIGMIDAELGKNNLGAVTNFTPEYPVEMDQGLSVGPSNPWALSADDVLINNNAVGAHSIIELLGRDGCRELVHCDARHSCYSPMPVKPRRLPPAIRSTDDSRGRSGRFLVVDVYQGLRGVQRGEVKRLRVVEETARISEVPPGGRWWNQAFLISWQGAYVVKNLLGTVPVHEDGSAYFEAPAGRALYLEALDAEGRELQRMRTYVQAVPGATRSCIGCHENKDTAPPRGAPLPKALSGPPARPRPESWGSGFVDYPTMVQPILDEHCVGCHGGSKGVSGGIDLTGGWTWAFSISYETLLKHNLVGFIRCENGDVTSSRILPPRTIGSGAAPLAEKLISGHKGRIGKLTRAQRDLILAWMDTNSNYYGTWDYTPYATCNALQPTAAAVAAEMNSAGCAKCHAPGRIGNDWINLRTPERSRVLRAPMAKAPGGLGLAWCRSRKAVTPMGLVRGSLPPDVFRPPKWPRRDPNGPVATTFASTGDPHYQRMLQIIRRGRSEALARARVDMPGAEIVSGQCRLQAPLPLPAQPPKLTARPAGEAVDLAWPRSAETIGLAFELHRSAQAGFTPTEKTRISELSGFRFLDVEAPAGPQHYALILLSGPQRSDPVRATVTVPPPKPPAAPTDLSAQPGPMQVVLEWQPPSNAFAYNVYRAAPGAKPLRKITEKPVGSATYADIDVTAGVKYRYAVRAVSRRGIEGPPSHSAAAAARAVSRKPIFVASFEKPLRARLESGRTVPGVLQGAAKAAGGTLDLTKGGHVSFAHRREFDLAPQFSMACWLFLSKPGGMPIVLSCGEWQNAGWFLQCFNGRWRWHVGGVDCDGGTVPVGRWVHVVCTFDGRRARVFQDGKQVALCPCQANLTRWPGRMLIGQYSATPGGGFQVFGRLTGVKLYRCALTPGEAAAAFKAGRP